MNAEKIIAELEKMNQKVIAFFKSAVFVMLLCDVIVYHTTGRMWFTDAGPLYGIGTILIGCLGTAYWYTSKLTKLLSKQ